MFHCPHHLIAPSDDQTDPTWFRRDLRLADQAAVWAAAQSGAPVIPVYILDDDTPGTANWARLRVGGCMDRCKASPAIWRPGQPVDPASRRGSRCSGAVGAGDRGAGDPRPASSRTVVAHAEKAVRARAGAASAPRQFLPRRAACQRPGTLSHLHAVLAGFSSRCRPRPCPRRINSPPDQWPESDDLEDWGLLPTARTGRRASAPNGRRARAVRRSASIFSPRPAVMPKGATCPRAKAPAACRPIWPLARSAPRNAGMPWRIGAERWMCSSPNWAGATMPRTRS
jgi:hypothetical protein